MEEEKLPVISPAPELACKHKILMKSPWEIHQSPVGSGGVLSLLANNILDNFSELGVEYVEVPLVTQSSPRKLSYFLNKVPKLFLINL